MTATGHALLGTLIAAKIGNPALAIPLALASHVITDAIPHWDTATNTKGKNKKTVFVETVMDVVLGFILSYALVSIFFPSLSLSYVFIIIIFTQIFDWLTGPYYFFKIKIFKPFYKFQKIFNKDLDAPWGVISQIVIIFLAFLLVKIF